MNLENYKLVSMCAVIDTETNKFSFVCQANNEGKKVCNTMAENYNTFGKTNKYKVTFFSGYIKKPQIVW